MSAASLTPRYVGVMGGRLLPPCEGRFQSFQRERWREELPAAAAAGLEAIEWVYDAFGEDVNPLATDAGVAELRRLADGAGVRVLSVCADWFMDRPLLRATEPERAARMEHLRWLLARCALLGAERLVLPFVDASRIEGDADRDVVLALLNALLPAALAHRVELHLETALGPREFGALLDALRHPQIRVNYDTGNSASLGYRPADEFAAYGRRVGSVHIKDRVLHGGTVPLGEGATDFAAVRAALCDVEYTGDVVLQIARGPAGDEVAWLAEHARRVRRWAREGALT